MKHVLDKSTEIAEIPEGLELNKLPASGGNGKKQTTPESIPWINPVGGLGDTLMLSGVLKLCYDQNPERLFKLVKRTKYWDLLEGHPAIIEQGNPPLGSLIQHTNYWNSAGFKMPDARAFQLLAEMFGLQTPVEEKLYLPGGIPEDKVLHDFLPWKKHNILIAPSSESPRKMMHPMAWQLLIERFTGEDTLVMQCGRIPDIPIKGAYILTGTTTPKELISLVSKCDLVITVDNFVMHAAKLTGTPAVVLWGPTKPGVYGYRDQVHITAPLHHCEMRDECIGPDFSENYSTACPLKEQQCMNLLSIDYMEYRIRETLKMSRL